MKTVSLWLIGIFFRFDINFYTKIQRFELILGLPQGDPKNCKLYSTLYVKNFLGKVKRTSINKSQYTAYVIQ